MPGAGILTFGPEDSRKYSRGQGADKIKESSELPVARRLYETVPYMLHALNTIALQQVDFHEIFGQAGLTMVVEFKINAGVEVTGKLVDEIGKPVSGAIATGQDGFGNSWYSLNDSSFQVRAFYPENPRKLGFYHPERELAAEYILEKVPAEPLIITLHPSGGVRGRLIDENGIPLVRYHLTGDGVPDQWHSNKHQPLVTDDEGRFEIRGLIPGKQYTVLGRSKPGANGFTTIGTVLKEITIESVQVRDVGDVKLQPRMDD